MNCDLCHGPCRLEDWARDTSNITNNPAAQRATIVRRHRWFRPDHVDAVKMARAALRAMPTSIVYPCVGCDRYAFPEPGTTCYWCKTKPVSSESSNQNGARNSGELLAPTIPNPVDDNTLPARATPQTKGKKRKSTSDDVPAPDLFS